MRRVIYFIQNETNKAIKIGHTDKVSNRLSQLQTASADRLRLLGAVPGGPVEEKDLHRRFQRHRLVGEWFQPHEEIIATLDALLKKHGMGGFHTGYWMANWDLLIPKLNAVVSKAMGFHCELAWINVGFIEYMETHQGPIRSVIKWRCEPLDEDREDFYLAWLDSEHRDQLFDTPVEAAAYFIGLSMGDAEFAL